MTGAFFILGANTLVIYVLHHMESKGHDIMWEVYELGVAAQLAYGLLKLVSKISVFL